MAGDHGGHGEGHGQIEDDDVALRHGAIVDGGAVPHGDRLLAHHRARAVDHDMADLVGARRLIADGVLLARPGIEVRMRGERALEAAAERVIDLRPEIVGEAHG